MVIEIVITVIIIFLALYIFIKNIKKKSKPGGGCDCGSCSTKCPTYIKKSK